MDKLRALKFFCAAVESKSFAAAAHDLDVVPSVLSKMISALEAEIDFRLFNRTTRSVTLTENGARYYEQCKKLLIDLEEAEAMSRAGNARPGGRLRAGMHPSVLIVFMRQLSAFMRECPEIIVETTLSGSPATLVEDKLDVLVTVGDLADSTLPARKLGTTRHVLVASPAYLAAWGTPATPAELAGHAVIGSGRRDGPSFIRWTLSRREEEETVFVPTRTISREGILMHEACLAGGGICRLAEFSVRSRIQAGDLVVVLPDWALGSLPIHAVFPSRKDLPAKTRAFVAFLQEVLRREL